jgi:hypothetical protein
MMKKNTCPFIQGGSSMGWQSAASKSVRVDKSMGSDGGLQALLDKEMEI